MSTQDFVEGDLHFHFPAHWGVRKYDQQRFYQRMGGMGLKAVDFLAIDPSEGGRLYLIEVKNYRTRIREGMVFEAPLKGEDVLAEAIATKYDHTIRAIRAIQVFYQRQWLYRLVRALLLKTSWWQYDTVFWAHANELTQRWQDQTVLLWMETEESAKDYRQAVAAGVRERLPEKVHFMVAEQAAPFPKELRVDLI